MLAAWPIPNSIHAARVFLGKVGYYNAFIDHFAEKARPLYNMLTLKIPENQIIVSSKEDTLKIKASVDALKTAVLNPPCLTLPDFADNASPFLLDCDYSEVCKTIGGCLSQEQPPGSGVE